MIDPAGHREDGVNEHLTILANRRCDGIGCNGFQSQGELFIAGSPYSDCFGQDIADFIGLKLCGI